ncbi:MULTISPECIES: hypothetical protein [Chryseobacterium]|uniref:Uncharacterized protein n=1 Tax=Chryseobacterium taihuense TaxID=1141221 RepID=A0A4U8WAK4_9FLAO|nr:MULTISPECIES: hypothetical protein [Chryseobacterium]QQV03456.1 hypothetical protein I6I61_03670 [Chryseobacterium sp. FDAARGOS 1104]VFB03222.1 Uncharacterised protein [Chryseobacterium taihuense]
MEEKTPVWRILLSVVFVIVVLVRIVNRCSTPERNSYSSEDYTKLTKSFITNRGPEEKNSEEASNNLFYESYDSIGKLYEENAGNFHITKLEKDSLFPLDLSTRINIEKNSYIQKSYDDTLKMAIKLPDNTSIFVHSYEGAGDMIENFKKVKNHLSLQNINVKLDKPETKYISYHYLKNGKKCFGYALLAQENRYFSFVEIENSSIPKSSLEKKTFNYVMQMTR